MSDIREQLDQVISGRGPFYDAPPVGACANCDGERTRMNPVSLRREPCKPCDGSGVDKSVLAAIESYREIDAILTDVLSRPMPSPAETVARARAETPWPYRWLLWGFR